MRKLFLLLALFLVPSSLLAQVPARSTPVTCERDDSTSTLSAADGTQTPCRVNARGAVWVDLETRLDQANDSITVYGSDDGGTTKRIWRTDSGGALVGANGNAKINCNNNAFLNMTTATTTQIVATSGSTFIYVCSYSIVSNGGTATNVKFVDGTGSNCATSQSDRSANIPLTAATNTVGIARGSGEGMIIKTSTAGDALCVTSSGAATIAIDISYAQF